MNTKRLMLAAVTQVVAVFILNAQALAVVIPAANYVDVLAGNTWNGHTPPNTTTAATAKAVAVGECFDVVIDNPYAFSHPAAPTIELRKLGATIDGGFVDQKTRDDGKIHEDWHDAIYRAVLTQTYGALETWSAAYKNGRFLTAAAAVAQGKADLAAALTLAKNAYNTEVAVIADPMAFGHDTTGAVIDMKLVPPTWRSVNPDWGKAAFDYANKITVPFVTTPATAPCAVPEPSTGMLLAFGVMGLAVAASRRRRC